MSFSEDEEREVNIYNDKGEIENLQPNGRKVKNKVPLIKQHGKQGMNNIKHILWIILWIILKR